LLLYLLLQQPWCRHGPCHLPLGQQHCLLQRALKAFQLLLLPAVVV
jgi:hypothetical protein